MDFRDSNDPKFALMGVEVLNLGLRWIPTNLKLAFVDELMEASNEGKICPLKGVIQSTILKCGDGGEAILSIFES